MKNYSFLYDVAKKAIIAALVIVFLKLIYLFYFFVIKPIEAKHQHREALNTAFLQAESYGNKLNASGEYIDKIIKELEKSRALKPEKKDFPLSAQVRNMLGKDFFKNREINANLYKAKREAIINNLSWFSIEYPEIEPMVLKYMKFSQDTDRAFVAPVKQLEDWRKRFYSDLSKI